MHSTTAFENLDTILPEFNVDELNYIAAEIDNMPKGSSVLDIVEWAIKNRYIPPELSAHPGPFDWALTPHLIELAMELSPSSAIRRVILCKGVQVGGTVLLENFIGHTIENDPCGFIYAREEKDAAQDAMDLQIDAMLEYSGLKERIFMTVDQKGSSGSKAVDRKLFKRFPGGYLYAIGVLNAKKLRSKPAKKLGRDEIDAWPEKTSGHEKGDPMELLEKRTATFKHSKKIFDLSTPLDAHNSRIWAALIASDFRKRFVPCPFCGEYQELVWYDKENDCGFIYEAPEGVLQPGSTHYKCRYCKGAITENYKAKMMQAGEWRATNLKPTLYMAAGFHLPSWYSLLEPWDDITIDWLKTIYSRDRKDALKNFHNLRMALPFEDVETSPSGGMLKGKHRNYLPNTVPNELAIKDGNGPILMLACAVDVHKNKKNNQGHLDVEIVGHCANGATYSIMWHSLKGDTEAYWFREHSAAYHVDEKALAENTWHRLETDILEATFISDDGLNEYSIQFTVIDSSYEPYMVHTFCKRYERNVVPIKGISKFKSLNDTFRLKDSDHGPFYQLVVDMYKDRLAEYMTLKAPAPGTPQPPGYLNYPAGDPYNKDYFDQYGGEHKVPVYDTRTGLYQSSYWKQKYDKIPNHAWDCRVYNMAALDIFVSIVCEAGNVPGIDYDYVFEALEANIRKA